MRVYHVRGKIWFGPDVLDVDIEIPRSQILAMKKQLRGDGYVCGDYITYDKMLIVTSHFAAHLRLRMVPGTWLILLLLKACLISVRLGIIAVVILLIMRRWWWAIASLALTYIVNTYLQTLINYELGARLLVLDQHLGELYKKNESGSANRSGESIERAIIIDAINVAEGIDKEYTYLEREFGKCGKDWERGIQSVLSKNGKNYDEISIQFHDGNIKKIYFDVTSWFGKL